MVTVIAARRCISVQPFMRMHKAHAHVDCCEAIHACSCLCVLVHKAHGDCDCCEAMHACSCLCVVVHKARGDCDCCEAMHACVFLFVCSCERGAWSL